MNIWKIKYAEIKHDVLFNHCKEQNRKAKKYQQKKWQIDIE